MVKEDFTKTYYRTAQCLTGDIIADMNPVSRAMGVDKTAGFGTVFTAMGSRFDVAYAAEEAFLSTECGESDTRSIDNVSIAEAMRYVRGETILEDKIPAKFREFVEIIKKDYSVYADFGEFSTGDPDADLVFLVSPASRDPKGAAAKFTAIAEKAGRSAYCTNCLKDAGYLAIQLGLKEQAETAEAAVKALLDGKKAVVTDDAYVLDAILMLIPEMDEKICMIDEFLALNADAVKPAPGKKVAVHESGIIERYYPLRKVDYSKLLGDSEVLLPARSGYDVSDSGIAGGLGLADPDALKAVSCRRMLDLAALGADVIVTPCACEALGLNVTAEGEVMTLLDYMCE